MSAPDQDDGPQSDSPNSDDRRRGIRHLACFPVHVQTGEDTPRTAVIHDLSVTGALLLTRTRLKVGEPVKLSLYVKGDPEQPVIVSGKVVRDERRSTEVSDVWHHSAAIHFDAPVPEIEAEVEQLAARQATFGLRKK